MGARGPEERLIADSSTESFAAARARRQLFFQSFSRPTCWP